MGPPEVIIRVERKTFIFFCAVALVAVLGRRLWSEVLTFTTTYPVASGIYNQLVTTGSSATSSADTTLNRNAGNAIMAPSTNAAGKVGIGTDSPAAKLDVAGDLGADSIRFTQSMQIGDDASLCAAAKTGSMRWHGGKWEVCDGSSWK